MKVNSIFYGLIISLFSVSSYNAQQWGGTLDQTNVIYRTGNVGIGITTTPTAKLELRQDSGESYGLRIRHSDNDQQIFLHIADNITGKYGYFTLGGITTFRSGGLNSSFEGNLGLGTNNPKEKLDVKGNVLISGKINFENNSDNLGSSTGIIGNPYGWTHFHPGYGTKSRFIMPVTNAEYSTKKHLIDIEAMEDGWRKLFTLYADGSAFFDGVVQTREIKVNMDAPSDFVFQKYYTGVSILKPEYQMLSLTEVEHFISENHHLPDLPSAKEIQDNGIHLGALNNLLLQKIEELTLYTLEQEKKIINQEQKNSELEERLKRLEEKFNTQ